jgi:hypothetical protein
LMFEGPLCALGDGLGALAVERVVSEGVAMMECVLRFACKSCTSRSVVGFGGSVSWCGVDEYVNARNSSKQCLVRCGTKNDVWGDCLSEGLKLEQSLR